MNTWFEGKNPRVSVILISASPFAWYIKTSFGAVELGKTLERGFWVISQESNPGITEMIADGVGKFRLTRSATPTNTASSECRLDTFGPGYKCLRGAMHMVILGRNRPAFLLFKAYKRP